MADTTPDDTDDEVRLSILVPPRRQVIDVLTQLITEGIEQGDLSYCPEVNARVALHDPRLYCWDIEVAQVSPDGWFHVRATPRVRTIAFNVKVSIPPGMHT